jgi:diphosphomevalonate decarboxylase
MRAACAAAGPNIALIKYWGNRDNALRIPANGSISITLAGLQAEIQVVFDEHLAGDSLRINGQPADPPAAARATAFLNAVRDLSGVRVCAAVEGKTNFPVGAGMASSAAAFAALAMAASQAAGLDLDMTELSRLARLGSGSACRSIFGGFVEWLPGETHQTSIAQPLFPAEHWLLADLVAIIDEGQKPVGSTEGHALAVTSPLQSARVADAPRRLEICRRAILERDFEALAQIVELDSNMMHGVMSTSTPALHYWQPATLAVMAQVLAWRRAGTPVCYTLDAGPTVHCLCEPTAADALARELARLPGVRRVLRTQPGPGVRPLSTETL